MSIGAGEQLPDDVQNCPPLNEYQLSRRAFLGNTAKILAGTAVAASGISKALGIVGNLYDEVHYSDEPSHLIAARDAEKSSLGGPEAILFMGLGQQDPTNSVNEYSEAIDHSMPVFGMYYSSWGYTAESLAIPIAQHIARRQPSSLTLIGSSMGFQTALSTSYVMYSQASQNVGMSDQGIELPKIETVIGYSSPSDLQDAFDGELADFVVAFCDKFNYTGDERGKFVTDAIQSYRTNGLVGRTALSTAIEAATWDALTNIGQGTPPKLWLSQIRLLRETNILLVGKEYAQSGMLVPGFRVIYTKPKLDSIVDDLRSVKNISRGLNSPVLVLSTGDTDHANPLKSAQVIGDFMHSGLTLADAGQAGYTVVYPKQ